MSSGHEPKNSWMFVRDEIDLLEEEFDEIFRRHGASSDPERRAMEESVLKEQLETEEATETHLTEQIGPRLLAASDHELPQADAMDEVDSVGSLREWMRRDATRDPFYEFAFLWATHVSRWARTAYDTQPEMPRDLFRVHVNACLVPAKIAFGQAEETHEHADAIELADKEYELAEVYVRRSIDSLRALHVKRQIPAGSEWMLEQAEEIARRLQELRRRIGGMRGFRAK